MAGTRREKRAHPVSENVLNPVEAFERLRQLVCNQPETVPPGFFRVEEWCEKQDLGPARVYQIFAKGVKAGLVEKRKFRIQIGDRVQPVPHYKMLTGK